MVLFLILMTDGSIHESHYHSVHDIFGAKKVSVYRGIMILQQINFNLIMNHDLFFFLFKSGRKNMSKINIK